MLHTALTRPRVQPGSRTGSPSLGPGARCGHLMVTSGPPKASTQLTRHDWSWGWEWSPLNHVPFPLCLLLLGEIQGFAPVYSLISGIAKLFKFYIKLLQPSKLQLFGQKGGSPCSREWLPSMWLQFLGSRPKSEQELARPGLLVLLYLEFFDN